MRGLFQIITQEYRKYVFTKGFLLLLLIVPLFLTFYIVGTQISSQAEPVRTFVVLDETGRFVDDIDGALVRSRRDRTVDAWDSYAARWVTPKADGTLPLDYPFAPVPGTDEERRKAFIAAGGIEAATRAAAPSLKEDAPEAPDMPERYIRAELPEGVAQMGTVQEQTVALVPYLRGDRVLPDGSTLFAAVVIPERFGDLSSDDDADKASFWATNLLAGDLRGFISSTLTRALRAEAIVDEGVDPVRAAEINTLSADIVPVTPAEDGGNSGAGAVVTTVIPIALAYALFIMTTTVGGMLLTNTVEEKSNKIVELLLSSVSASQLMIGKLIALALVGLTIPTILFGTGFIFSQIFGVNAAPEGARAVFEAVQGRLFETALVPMFLCYFVLGYLFFASIYLGVGALSNSVGDANSFTAPITLLLLMPLPFLGLIVGDPNGLVARIITWIPIYTPYAVMLRLGGEPPVWEIVGATALLIATVSYVLFIMGRVYRNGVLGSGGAPSWKAIFKLSK